jgi:DNA-directed RNA polymerase
MPSHAQGLARRRARSESAGTHPTPFPRLTPPPPPPHPAPPAPPPGTVSAMNRVLREQFVALHTQRDLLADLADQLREAYPGIKLPPLPPRGGLDVSRVLRSRYFFS